MSRMHKTLVFLLACLACHTAAMDEIKPQHGGSLESVDILPNGTVKTYETYEAVHLSEAATKALPDDKELESLLHWAISKSQTSLLSV